MPIFKIINLCQNDRNLFFLFTQPFLNTQILLVDKTSVNH